MPDGYFCSAEIMKQKTICTFLASIPIFRKNQPKIINGYIFSGKPAFSSQHCNKNRKKKLMEEKTLERPVTIFVNAFLPMPLCLRSTRPSLRHLLPHSLFFYFPSFYLFIIK